MTATVLVPQSLGGDIRDDDQRYTITSYSLRTQTAEHASVANDTTSDPRTYVEAMSRPDAAKWEMACTDELRSFEQMGVYEVILRP